jgi:F-type H+-transporting ATPase subunit gamma
MEEVVEHLADTPDAADHPFFREVETGQTVAVIVITSDRGLAGGYNSSVIRAAERRVRRHKSQGREVQLVVTGRKGESYFRYRRQVIAASLAGISEKPAYQDARRVVAAVMAPFQAGELDQIDLVYTRFISLGSQSVVERELIPLPRHLEQGEPDSDGRRDASARAERATPGAGEGGAVPGHKTDYEFEPEPAEILDRLLPRWLESEVLFAMLNAAASEQAARQRAMKAATDNADELIKTLRRVMNRARQDSITTEIMEIVGGAEALRQAGLSDGSGPYHETFIPVADSA